MSIFRTFAALVSVLTLSGLLSVNHAQQPTQQPAVQRSQGYGVGDTSIFAPLPLPTPNEYRSASGAPGPKYWQNRADYTIKATLDTAEKRLRGSMTMQYTNNSPDTLDFIWMQMDQNAFREGSLNSYVFPPTARFGARNFQGGYTLDGFAQIVNGKPIPLQVRDQETLLKVTLAKPLAPGQSVTFDVAWQFLIPEHGADRMGRDGALYELAQWYPRVAVYDDVRGWNIEPYLGQGEFYLEYGDFTLEITVPAGYIVAATGMLDNPEDVLTQTQIRRLAAAAKSDTTIRIITEEELRSGAARPKRAGTLTWRFKAKNVRDVAWAASPDYLWDAVSWKGILAQAYYRPAATLWHDAADQARMSIQEYSERWYMYPYPQISAVEGPVYGMEYPMLAMQTAEKTKYDLFGVLTHEVGHNWFPMIVGTNERTHFWMDEGMNSFINTFAEARRFPEKGDQMQRAAQERAMIERSQQLNIDVPIDIPADRIDPSKLGFTEYVKVSVGLQLLRQEILGPEVFDEALKTYIKRWAFKHPTPADFYRTMENVAGRRLDWFWRGWFIENPHFDQAIDSVKAAVSGDSTFVGVWYANRARGVLPILVRFTFDDGTVQDFNYPAEVWSTNTIQYARPYLFVKKIPVKVELDPDQRLIDINRKNNVWNVEVQR
jgi:hypothetical protein